MKRRYWAGAAALVVVLVIIGVRIGKSKAVPEQTVAELAAIEFLSSELTRAAQHTLTRELPVTGTLQAIDRTILKTKVAGTLQQLDVRPGSKVRKGDVVGRIDPTTYAARLRAQEADLASNRASLELATKQRDNNKALLDKGFISKNAFDSNLKETEVARAMRDASQAQLDLSRQALQDTQLRAPLSGVVAERYAQQGETLPIDGQVISIVDLSRLEIEVAVPASEIGSVRIGQPFSLTAQGLDTPLTGKAVRIAPTTTAGTRSIMVYVEVDNSAANDEQSNQAARVGMFVRGVLAAGQHEAAVSVPQSAVREERGQQVVYTIEDGHVARKLVTLGASGVVDGEAWVEVLTGLPIDATVVRTPGGPLTPGAAARIKTALQR